MKFILNTLLLASILCFFSCDTSKKVAATTAPPSKETVMQTTPGSITFEAANQRYSANGKFNKWNFTDVKMEKNNIESLNANINIDLTSIWEKSDKLTEHLKAWDYFDVEKFQNAMLKISNVRAKGKNMYVADMELSMRDKSQKMESVFTLIDKKTMRVQGSAMVDRGIFGIAVDNTSVPNLIKVSYDTVIPQ